MFVLLLLLLINTDRKIRGCSAPFRRGIGSPSNTMSLGPRPTSVPSGILIHPAVWRQYTNVTHRQDNGPVTCDGRPKHKIIEFSMRENKLEVYTRCLLRVNSVDEIFLLKYLCYYFRLAAVFPGEPDQPVPSWVLFCYLVRKRTLCFFC